MGGASGELGRFVIFIGSLFSRLYAVRWASLLGSSFVEHHLLFVGW